MATSTSVAQVHKMINEGSTGSLLKEHRQVIYAKIVSAVKQLPMGPKWNVLYSDSSVTIHTLGYKTAIKISINNRVYIDRKLKAGVRSNTFECNDLPTALKTAFEHFHRFNKTGVINHEQSSEVESREAA